VNNVYTVGMKKILLTALIGLAISAATYADDDDWRSGNAFDLLSWGSNYKCHVKINYLLGSDGKFTDIGIDTSSTNDCNLIKLSTNTGAAKDGQSGVLLTKTMLIGLNWTNPSTNAEVLSEIQVIEYMDPTSKKAVKAVPRVVIKGEYTCAFGILTCHVPEGSGLLNSI